jgi:hypothetical protein
MNRIYLGKHDGEEMYLNLDDGHLNGWSLMGLRPETEENLRIRQREQDPEDVGINIEKLERYFDYDKFHDDMEEEWENHHDSQGEYNIDDETYYLGFGSGQDIFGFIEREKIISYKKWKETFEDTPISGKQYNEFKGILQVYKVDNKKSYEMFLEWSKDVSMYPNFTDEYEEENK